MSHAHSPSDAIREHWMRAAMSKTDAQGLKPTARDPYLQRCVEDAVARHVKDGARLFDIGCGDGASTALFAQRCASALGMDFIDDYVRRALEVYGRPNLSFEQANVLDLGGIRDRHGLCDVMVSIRCLINLTDFSSQAKGIEQIANLVAPGGLYLASEGWLEGFDGLNRRREKHGLAPMTVAQYNLLLPRADFEREARRYFEIIGYESLGYYLFMSRVFQPLFTQPESPSHTHPINRVAAQTQTQLFDSRDFLDCDYAGLYVLRRK